MDYTVIIQHWDRLLPGLVQTFFLFGTALIFSFLLGTILAVFADSHFKPLRKAIEIYIFIFQGTPFIVQLFFFYYGLPQLPFIKDSCLWNFFSVAERVAALTLSLNTCAYTTAIFKDKLRHIDATLIEAGRACGLSAWHVLRYIRLPLMFRGSIEQYANEIIFTLHATSLAGAITVSELSSVAGQMSAEFYVPFEAYTSVALIYLLITLFLSGPLWFLRRLVFPENNIEPSR